MPSVQSRTGVSKLRPGGQMQPAGHFESAQKYNGVWPTNETCACLVLYFLNIDENTYYTVFMY